MVFNNKLDPNGRPTRLVIGPYEYAVRWTPLYRNEGFAGTQNHLTLCIDIDESLPSSLMATTFLHEVLHAIYRVLHQPEEALSHEAQADLYASGLVAFWRDNQSAFNWWMNLVRSNE